MKKLTHNDIHICYRILFIYDGLSHNKEKFSKFFYVIGILLTTQNRVGLGFFNPE